MARRHSHMQFFRRVSNVQLEHYFHQKRNVLKEIALEQFKETEVEPIFQAFTALPPEQQAEIEIDTMACQAGVTALTDEADFHGDEDFPEAIAKVLGFHGKIMRTLLEHHKYWGGATLLQPPGT